MVVRSEAEWDNVRKGDAHRSLTYAVALPWGKGSTVTLVVFIYLIASTQESEN